MKKFILIIALLLISSSAYASFRDIVVRANSVTVIRKNITQYAYYCWGRAVATTNRGNTYRGEWKEMTLLPNQTGYWHVYNNSEGHEFFEEGLDRDIHCRQENYEINH